MSRETRGPIWVQTNKDGTVSVGLTANFVRAKMGECFHIMQADLEEVLQGQPMLVFETNDGLESIKAPTTGSILKFNRRAVDFPDKLTEDEVILTILPRGVEKKSKAKVTTQRTAWWIDEV